MPTWKNVLPDDDLWAMARYVASLIDLLGTAASGRTAGAIARAAPPGRPRRHRHSRLRHSPTEEPATRAGNECPRQPAPNHLNHQHCNAAAMSLIF